MGSINTQRSRDICHINRSGIGCLRCMGTRPLLMIRKPRCCCNNCLHTCRQQGMTFRRRGCCTCAGNLGCLRGYSDSTSSGQTSSSVRSSANCIPCCPYTWQPRQALRCKFHLCNTHLSTGMSGSTTCRCRGCCNRHLNGQMGNNVFGLFPNSCHMHLIGSLSLLHRAAPPRAWLHTRRRCRRSCGRKADSCTGGFPSNRNLCRVRCSTCRRCLPSDSKSTSSLAWCRLPTPCTSRFDTQKARRRCTRRRCPAWDGKSSRRCFRCKSRCCIGHGCRLGSVRQPPDSCTTRCRRWSRHLHSSVFGRPSSGRRTFQKRSERHCNTLRWPRVESCLDTLRAAPGRLRASSSPEFDRRCSQQAACSFAGLRRSRR